MSNIITAKVTIVGTRPILFHKFGRDAIPLEKRQEKTGVAGNDPEEWKRGYSVTKDNQLYVDPSYVFGCLRDGAKHTKKGKGSIQSLVAATLQVVDGRVLLDRFMPDGVLSEDPDEPVYLDVRGVRNPNSKGMNIRYRVACSPGWKSTFTLMWDKTIVTRHEMQAALIDAGKLCGLADARKIGFGRFDVEEFEVAEG